MGIINYDVIITSLIYITRWDYDIIHLERVCQEARRLGPLYYVGLRIFKDFNVSETLGVDETIISCWLKVSTVVEPLIMDTLRVDNLPKMDSLFAPCIIILSIIL